MLDNSSAGRRSSRHPIKQNLKTPDLGQIHRSIFPTVRVDYWLDHTSKMLLFEWLPLTYFTMASIIAPRDNIGCHKFANKVTEQLTITVFGPVLALRFLGILFLNQRDKIWIQIIVIYGYLIISLTFWDIRTIN